MATGSPSVVTDVHISESDQIISSHKTAVQRVAGWFAVASVVLLSLAVVAALVFPLWLRWTYDMNWIFPEPEYPAWSLWLPLMFQERGSFVYHYAGAVHWLLLGYVHNLTQLVLGSSMITFRYIKLYGYLAESLYVLIQLALLIAVLSARSLSIYLKQAVALYMVLVSAAFLDLYLTHYFKLSVELSFPVMCAFAVTLDLLALEAVMTRGHCPAWLALAAGVLAGICFLSLPLYLYFSLFFGLALLFLPSIRSFMRAAAIAAIGGIVGIVGLQLLLYRFDLAEASAALISHVLGLTEGLAMQQPGFADQYFDHFLLPTSMYYLHQVFMMLGIAVAAICLLVSVPINWARPFQRQRLVQPALSLAYLLVIYAHWKVTETHGSNTITNSVTFLTAAYFSLLLYVCQAPWGQAAPLIARSLGPLAVATTAVLLVTLCRWPSPDSKYMHWGQQDFAAMGRANHEVHQGIESYERLLTAVADDVTVIGGGSHYMTQAAFLAWLDYVGDGFYHWGKVFGAQDFRADAFVAQRTLPHYHYYWPQAIVDVSAQCTATDAAVYQRYHGTAGQCIALQTLLGTYYINSVNGRSVDPVGSAWVIPLGNTISPDPATVYYRDLANSLLGQTPITFIDTAHEADGWNTIRHTSRAGLAYLEPATGQAAFPGDASGGITTLTGVDAEKHLTCLFDASIPEQCWLLLPLDPSQIDPAADKDTQALLQAGYRPYLSAVKTWGPTLHLLLINPTAVENGKLAQAVAQ